MEKMSDTYQILVGKPEVKRPLERSRSRWKGNTNIDLKVIGYEGVEWTEVV
jgi:hypothetical protein